MVGRQSFPFGDGLCSCAMLDAGRVLFCSHFFKRTIQHVFMCNLFDEVHCIYFFCSSEVVEIEIFRKLYLNILRQNHRVQLWKFGVSPTAWFCRWWFQIFLFLPEQWGDDPVWLINIFQMGWNHQLLLTSPTPKKSSKRFPFSCVGDVFSFYLEHGTPLVIGLLFGGYKPFITRLNLLKGTN